MDNQKKILVRIQLVNWHYFENERITLHGSTLVSGENTAGKSTILDAIQLVLTTNTRRFNVAANEKGNRNLKGYVRCKVGSVGETYLRKNVVPANVALEFYEERGGRYFVMGVHMTSPDEESPVATRWYVEECRLEDMTFIVENRRPALAEEFLAEGRKIRYIEQKNAARDRFKRRLGNLEDKFFDIIPKSLAFKPMDNVKEFINKFVLSETRIDVASLRENIETLGELENLLERSERQCRVLEQIVGTYEAIEKKDYDITVNDILLDLAQKDVLRQEIEDAEKDMHIKSQTAEQNRKKLDELQKQLDAFDEQIIGINVAIQSNSSTKLVEDANRRIKEIQENIRKEEVQETVLNTQIRELKSYLRELHAIGRVPLTISEAEQFSTVGNPEEKNKLLEKIASFQREPLEEIRNARAGLLVQSDTLSAEIAELQERLKELGKRNLTYPAHTKMLKEAIEQEFDNRRINSKVYILSELLEITDENWVNAVEGYLNWQKFYLIVEPEYYEIALEVYERMRQEIHTAGIIHTGKIPCADAVDNRSLACVVRSENRYAKAYADYMLGRIIRCGKVGDLEQHDIAITAECVLYQGYVVRHINPKNYQNPYIGQNAYRVQIINTREELEEKSRERSSLREQLRLYGAVLEQAGKFDFSLFKMNLNAPENLREARKRLASAQAALENAAKDPTLIQLNLQLEETAKEKKALSETLQHIRDENTRLSVQIETAGSMIKQAKDQCEEAKRILCSREDSEGAAYQEAQELYSHNRMTRTAKKTTELFQPKRAQLEREKNGLADILKGQQQRFNLDFTQDFAIGLSSIGQYQEALQKLKSVEIMRCEENLRQVKEDCEQIFKSDFLSRMKEHIENAKNEFRSLNKALEDIYYGDDSYYFKLTYDKKKEGLYKMITSDNNQEGINLWTADFEAEYHEEMSDLFEKLMTKDDNGRKTVEEYTDYRSYLDYDIEIRKRDGSVQRFSDIYGEKSGSETQVPYYVAIAASFYQLYRYGNSVRIMLLDEAFDKMDDERIGAMLDFFNGLDLQVIMATPPAKIETIGEKVDTVLAAIRVGQSSIVEEYIF